jgi:membrane fusion protein (multidrug efflux system)
MRKKVALVILIVLVVASLIGLYKYIEFNKNYASSNAVFVKSDSLTYLSFKLPGKIEKIYVNEGDKVKKGDLLAKLDTKDLELKKEALKNNIASLDEKIKATVIQKQKLQKDITDNISLIKENIKKLTKTIEAKKHAIKAKEYKLEKLKSDYLRFKKLYMEKKISREKFDNVKTAYLALNEEIKADKKILSSMQEDMKILNIKLNLAKNSFKEVKRLQKVINSMKESKKALLKNLALVKQNINDSYLYAPFSGEIAKRFLHSSEVVGAGQRVLAEVNLKDLYVLDLLEETKMKGIGPGCEVKIHIDALDKDFKGYVSKILPASAATFALVPRDISSGEFTKLAQRFYVRIRFKKLPENVLVGMSGEVVIKRCKK